MMDNDCCLVGDVKEEAIANNLAGMVHQSYLMKDSEILWMQALDEQAARIVVEIALPIIELTIAE